MIDLFL